MIFVRKNKIEDTARDVMNIFETEISKQIQTHKLAFEEELYEFVKKEQKGIDSIIDIE